MMEGSFRGTSPGASDKIEIIFYSDVFFRGGRMRERRWESQSTFDFEEVMALCDGLRRLDVPIKGADQEVACYLEEFCVSRLEEIDCLAAWTVDEVTLVEVLNPWEGDFFLLAAKHHDLFQRCASSDGYLSIGHPWHVPDKLGIKLHHREGMFWIGFRQPHGFVRLRIAPNEVITPGERRGEAKRYSWMAERASILGGAIELLGLPLFIDWGEDALSITSEDPAGQLACSWPDAFGPCQIEYTISDRYELLVPAARFISKLGHRPSTLRTFLSGYPREVLKNFHDLQPESKLFYRGYIQAKLKDLPALVESTAPTGRVIANLSEFQTGRLVVEGEDAYAVLGIVGNLSGFKIEMRLNRAPLPEEKMKGWLQWLLGTPMIYSPLPPY